VTPTRRTGPRWSDSPTKTGWGGARTHRRPKERRGYPPGASERKPRGRRWEVFPVPGDKAPWRLGGDLHAPVRVDAFGARRYARTHLPSVDQEGPFGPDRSHRVPGALLDRPGEAQHDRSVGQQVRVQRGSSQYALYTVSEARQESPDSVARMGLVGRKRLGTSEEFAATVKAQVPNPVLTEAEAKERGEFVERLADDGSHEGLIAIAPTASRSSPAPTDRPSA
jgi:hypothetical protein